MRIFLKCLLLCASTFAAAYMARILIIPNVAPIAEGDDPNWRIQLAFLLTSVQNIGLFGMAVVVIAAALVRMRLLCRAISAPRGMRNHVARYSFRSFRSR